MSKGQNSKKDSKKKAVRTMQEKKNLKREKKNGLMSYGSLNLEKGKGSSS